MKADSTMRRHERSLRKLVEEHPDPVVQRIAQSMETALRWARLDTTGWPAMGQEAQVMAVILRRDLGLPPNGEVAQ